jgi:hypothetical protein
LSVSLSADFTISWLSVFISKYSAGRLISANLDWILQARRQVDVLHLLLNATVVSGGSLWAGTANTSRMSDQTMNNVVTPARA